MNKYKIVFIVFFLIILPTFSIAGENSEESAFVNYDYISEVSINTSTIPYINAKHAIVLDRASKSVLFGKQENEICKMASTTKIMTAIIVIENCKDLNELVTISKKSARNRRI